LPDQTQLQAGDVESLKAQVMSLIQESRELSAKLDIASRTIESKSKRYWFA